MTHACRPRAPTPHAACSGRARLTVPRVDNHVSDEEKEKKNKRRETAFRKLFRSAISEVPGGPAALNAAGWCPSGRRGTPERWRCSCLPGGGRQIFPHRIARVCVAHPCGWIAPAGACAGHGLPITPSAAGASPLFDGDGPSKVWKTWSWKWSSDADSLALRAPAFIVGGNAKRDNRKRAARQAGPGGWRPARRPLARRQGQLAPGSSVLAEQRTASRGGGAHKSLDAACLQT